MPVRFALCLLLAGCATRMPREMDDNVQAVLAEPDELVLYSLFPYRDTELLGEREVFHTYTVLGKAELDEADRKRVLDAILGGFAKSDGNAPDCFHPRHALRATRGGETVDMVLCFECRYVTWHLDGKPVGSRATTPDPQAELDAVLKAHDVPLPDK